MTDFFRAACEIVGGDGAEKAAKAVSGPEIDREAVAALASRLASLPEFQGSMLARNFLMLENGSFESAGAFFPNTNLRLFEAALLLLVADYVAERRAALNITRAAE